MKPRRGCWFSTARQLSLNMKKCGTHHAIVINIIIPSRQQYPTQPRCHRIWNTKHMGRKASDKAYTDSADPHGTSVLPAVARTSSQLSRYRSLETSLLCYHSHWAAIFYFLSGLALLSRSATCLMYSRTAGGTIRRLGAQQCLRQTKGRDSDPHKATVHDDARANQASARGTRHTRSRRTRRRARTSACIGRLLADFSIPCFICISSHKGLAFPLFPHFLCGRRPRKLAGLCQKTVTWK